MGKDPLSGRLFIYLNNKQRHNDAREMKSIITPFCVQRPSQQGRFRPHTLSIPTRGERRAFMHTPEGRGKRERPHIHSEDKRGLVMSAVEAHGAVQHASPAKQNARPLAYNTIFITPSAKVQFSKRGPSSWKPRPYQQRVASWVLGWILFKRGRLILMRYKLSQRFSNAITRLADPRVGVFPRLYISKNHVVSIFAVLPQVCKASFKLSKISL